ncbi:MAG: sigma-70 family RNA polymerase sigma factor, partial [Gemmatimonadetes bacterium]|nr:sigma-70 family RNA polymerase sigma factor [Gemmatimonadota bacterium]
RRDEEAFRSLYRRHTPALYALARRLMADEQAAGDVVQDAWVRAVAGLGRFAWQSALRTWLSSIVVNCCRERWSARGDRFDDIPLDASARADDPLLRVDLERALASLPTGYRTVLVLHDVEGYTHEEIAAQLGVEPGTSKSQLSRARRALRLRLAS